MITYIDTPTESTVKLGGKVVGKIRQVEGGWQYFPKGQKTGGQVYPSRQQVKNSL